MKSGLGERGKRILQVHSPRTLRASESSRARRAKQRVLISGNLVDRRVASGFAVSANFGSWARKSARRLVLRGNPMG
jgi:hypothetical protein